MPIKYSKLSDYKIKKIIKCFCSDIDATKTSEILGLNRKTINRYYSIFRAVIFAKQQSDKKLFFGEMGLLRFFYLTAELYLHALVFVVFGSASVCQFVF